MDLVWIAMLSLNRVWLRKTALRYEEKNRRKNPYRRKKNTGLSNTALVLSIGGVHRLFRPVGAGKAGLGAQAASLRGLLACAALRGLLSGLLCARELHHEVVNRLIRDGNDFLWISLELTPQLECSWVGLEVCEIKVQPGGAQEQHVLHLFPIRLRVGFGI